MELVSIGVPTYNRPKTLERTLRCLVNQTYSNLEIIVSDNYSTNPEVEIVMGKFAGDSRIRFFKQEENRGAIFNFNFVLEKCQGTYVMRLADDDWIDSNYIECCVAFLNDNSDYIAATGVTQIFDESEKFVRFDSKIDMSQSSAKERVKHYYENVFSNGCSYALMRKEYLKYFHFENRLADDWLAVARVAYLGKYKLLENTNNYLSTGGVSQSVDNITAAFKMSLFTKTFPYFKVGLNIFADIVWYSEAFRNLNFFSRIKFGMECYNIIKEKFDVKTEIKRGWKGYFRSLLRFGVK